MLDDGTVDGLRTLLVSRGALSGHSDLFAVAAGAALLVTRLFTEDLVCWPNSQLKSNEVVRPGKRIGRVGADDDGNLCVVRRSEWTFK